MREFLSIFNYKEGTQTITFEEAAQAASKGNGLDFLFFRLLRNYPFPQRGEAQTDIQAKIPTEEQNDFVNRKATVPTWYRQFLCFVQLISDYDEIDKHCV